jgi:hypothetical protein
MALVLAEATGRRLGSIRQLEWQDTDTHPTAGVGVQRYGLRERDEDPTLAHWLRSLASCASHRSQPASAAINPARRSESQSPAFRDVRTRRRGVVISGQIALRGGQHTSDAHTFHDKSGGRLSNARRI